MLRVAMLLTICSIPDVSNISSAIQALTPSTSLDQARSLSVSIKKYSEEFGIKWELVVAILKQESNFKTNAVNYQSGDFGISQFNYRNVVARKLDIAKLLGDSDYAIHQTFLFLKELKSKYGKIDSKNGRLWAARFHSSNPYHQDKYQKLLALHMKEINYVGRRIEFGNNSYFSDGGDSEGTYYSGRVRTDPTRLRDAR